MYNQRQTICITPTQFREDKLIISKSQEIILKGNIKMKLSEISYLNDNNEPCNLYLSLPKVSTFGPHPQYKFGSASKTAEDVCGYTISYSNKNVFELFKLIHEICTKKIKKLELKPVFINNKHGFETAYFKIKMNEKNMCTTFYSDKKCIKKINGIELIGKYGECTPVIHLRNIYYGNHNSSEYNASLQMNIPKAVFIETPLYTPDPICSDDDDDLYEEEYTAPKDITKEKKSKSKMLDDI